MQVRRTIYDSKFTLSFHVFQKLQQDHIDLIHNILRNIHNGGIFNIEAQGYEVIQEVNPVCLLSCANIAAVTINGSGIGYFGNEGYANATLFYPLPGKHGAPAGVSSHNEAEHTQLHQIQHSCTQHLWFCSDQ